MLENSLQDIILLWQEFGLDDHFHLSFLPAQAQVLEAESYFLTLYLPFETVFQLELLDMALSLNKFRLELLGYDTKLLRDGWTASTAAGTLRTSLWYSQKWMHVHEFVRNQSHSSL